MPPAECPAGLVCRMDTYENEQISRSGRHRNYGPVGQLGSSGRHSRLPWSAAAPHPLRVGVCAPGRVRPGSGDLCSRSSRLCPAAGGVRPGSSRLRAPAGLLRGSLGTTRLRLPALHLRSPGLERAWGLGLGPSTVRRAQAALLSGPRERRRGGRYLPDLTNRGQRGQRPKKLVQLASR